MIFGTSNSIVTTDAACWTTICITVLLMWPKKKIKALFQCNYVTNIFKGYAFPVNYINHYL